MGFFFLHTYIIMLYSMSTDRFLPLLLFVVCWLFYVTVLLIFWHYVFNAFYCKLPRVVGYRFFTSITKHIGTCLQAARMKVTAWATRQNIMASQTGNYGENIELWRKKRRLVIEKFTQGLEKGRRQFSTLSPSFSLLQISPSLVICPTMKFESIGRGQS